MKLFIKVVWRVAAATGWGVVIVVGSAVSLILAVVAIGAVALLVEMVKRSDFVMGLMA